MARDRGAAARADRGLEVPLHEPAVWTEAYDVEVGEEDRAAEKDGNLVGDLAAGEQIRPHPAEEHDGGEQRRAEGDPFRLSGGAAPRDPSQPEAEGGEAERQGCERHLFGGPATPGPRTRRRGPTRPVVGRRGPARPV